MGMTIHETFGSVAGGYRSYRPGYPDALFDFLAAQAPARNAAWDVGCGSGQATLPLAERFGVVFATDPSAAQIARAPRHPAVRYGVARAEASGLPGAGVAGAGVAGAGVDLVSAAQAAHWFEHDGFAAEVRRVARPRALVALFGYGKAFVSPEVDAVVEHLYTDLVGADWPPERRYIEDGYRSIPFPFAELPAPAFDMRAEWTLDQLLGYLRTWSAVARYRAREGEDPVALVEARLAAAWGPGARVVRWPLLLRAGRV